MNRQENFYGYKKIDKNFDTTFIPPEDIEWFSARENPFSIHGVFYSEEESLLPLEDI